jgi:biotin--protein ligase
MRNIIYVYNDAGVGARASEVVPQLFRSFPGYAVSTIDAVGVCAGSWVERAAVIVMPGGADRPYQAALSGAGNRAIREYVLGGGSYLGLCAGGYYGAASIEFDRGLPTAIVEERELKFFMGAAVGPAYGAGSYDPYSERGARLSQLMDQTGQVGPVYFNGGCYFPGAALIPGVEILARYTDIDDLMEEKPAAVIRCAVGKGVAVLSGVHPEYTGTVLQSHAATSHFHEALERSGFRGRLMNRIIGAVGLGSVSAARVADGGMS